MPISRPVRWPVALLAVAVIPVGLAAPVITAPQPAPRAVAARVEKLALSGVDRPAQAALAAAARIAPQSVGAAPARAASQRLAVLTAQRKTTAFSLLGLSWDRAQAPADVSVLVRVRTGGSWSGWTPLEQNDAAADANTPEGKRAAGMVHTEPLWAGPSDGVQVRVDSRTGAAPPDLKLTLIDPGSSPADAVATRTVTAGSTARAAAGQPRIVSRAAWGADERLRRVNSGCGTPSYTSTIKAAFVHHTVNANGYSLSQVPALIRGIYAYHVRTNGWCDIGYNFLVDRFGNLYEGRYGGIERAVLGAHTGGFNTTSFGISAIGNFDTAGTPSAMVSAISRLIAWKLTINYRNPLGKVNLTSAGSTRYAAGQVVSFNVISGHRDASLTACPGRYLYAQLPNIRRLVSSYIGAGIYDPALSGSSAPYGYGGKVTLTARTLTAQTWRLDIYGDGSTSPIRSYAGDARVSRSINVTWDLRSSTGALAPVNGYRLVLTSSGGARTFTGRFIVAVPPQGLPDPPPLSAVFMTSGTRVIGAYTWKTSCTGAPPMKSYKCTTSILGLFNFRLGVGVYVTKVGWRAGPTVYHSVEGPTWYGNMYATPGRKMNGKVPLNTVCTPNSSIGPRWCRTDALLPQLQYVRTSTGYVWRYVNGWQLIVLVRLTNP